MTPTENIENVQVRGVTWTKLIWIFCVIIGFLLSIEATILGIYFDTKSQVITNTNSIKKLDEQTASLRSDVNSIKEQNSGFAADINNLRD